jgi:hypothetical protein
MLLNYTGVRAADAYMQARALIVEFLLQGAPPSPPPRVDVDERELAAFAGDYGLANPRQQLLAFVERLSPALRLYVVDGRLHLTQAPRPRFDVELVPLGGGRFRLPMHSGSHIALAHDGDGRRVLVVHPAYLVEQPRWLGPLVYYAARAIFWLLFSSLALPIAALIWRQRGVPVGWGWPLLALVSFVATPVLFVAAALQHGLGERTPLTVGICATTIAFAVAAAGALVQPLRRWRQPLPAILKLHRLLVGLAAAGAAAYFASHRLIGICLWRY